MKITVTKVLPTKSPKYICVWQGKDRYSGETESLKGIQPGDVLDFENELVDGKYNNIVKVNGIEKNPRNTTEIPPKNPLNTTNNIAQAPSDVQMRMCALEAASRNPTATSPEQVVADAWYYLYWLRNPRKDMPKNA